MQNRRVHPRFSTSLSVEIFTRTASWTADAKNLSQGGLGVAINHPLPEGELVGLSMFLVEEGIEDATTEPLNVRGQICWCTASEDGNYLAGIRFAPLQPQELTRLTHFLHRLIG